MGRCSEVVACHRGMITPTDTSRPKTHVSAKAPQYSGCVEHAATSSSRSAVSQCFTGGPLRRGQAFDAVKRRATDPEGTKANACPPRVNRSLGRDCFPAQRLTANPNLWGHPTPVRRMGRSLGQLGWRLRQTPKGPLPMPDSPTDAPSNQTLAEEINRLRGELSGAAALLAFAIQVLGRRSRDSARDLIDGVLANPDVQESFNGEGLSRFFGRVTEYLTRNFPDEGPTATITHDDDHDN